MGIDVNQMGLFILCPLVLIILPVNVVSTKQDKLFTEKKKVFRPML